MLSHYMYTYTDVFHDNSQCKMLPAHCEVNTVDQGLNAIKGYSILHVRVKCRQGEK